jgi:hypothetical protein
VAARSKPELDLSPYEPSGARRAGTGAGSSPARKTRRRRRRTVAASLQPSLLAIPTYAVLSRSRRQNLLWRGVTVLEARFLSTLEVAGVAFQELTGDQRLEGELLAVAEAAGARLRAETDQDAEAERAAADALLQAASSAMAAGHSLSQIARTEGDGKETVRRRLRTDALKLVERTGDRARQMQVEHYQAIARATRLGLPMREIAQAAGVTHGTIRAINNRLASQGTGSGIQVTGEAHESHPVESDVQLADRAPGAEPLGPAGE